MDDHRRGRRQNEAPYQGSDPRFAADQSQIRGFSGASAERFRPPPLTTSPSTARGATAATAYSGYYPEPAPSFPATLPPNTMQSNTMQYQQNYGQDQRQQQQQQSFGGYNTADLMYGVAQPSAQNNVYDTNPQFQPRQPAAMQLLSDVAAAPYFSNDNANSSAQPGLQQHHAASGSGAVYQQQQHQSPDVRGPLLQQPYATGMSMGNLPQVAPEILEPEDDYQAQGQAPNLAEQEASYISYQSALKEIFQNIVNGRLSEAAVSLLNISEWLLGNVVELGLILDDMSLHGQRISLWGEFNNAWLGIFQKQKDMLQAGQRVQHPQSLMAPEFINKMAKDLIRMCDAIEKHGLVDYQYGVAEEQIIMILSECLDLQESLKSGSHNPGVGRAPP